MKTKSIVIILVTLIIGFVIGFLVNGQITEGRIQNFVKQGTSDGFKMHFYDIIQPDESQKIAIEPILDQYAVKIDQIVDGFRSEMKTTHNEMIQKLVPFLNEDQIERLKAAQERFERGERNRPGRGRGPMGPPPDRPRRGKW